MEVDPRRVITWVLTIVVPIVAAVLLGGFLRYMPQGTIIRIAEEHFAAVIGLPLAALLAAFIVVALRFSEGPVKFEGLGFKFEGASGQVVLWVFCFLAIAGAIRVMWSA